MKTTNEAGYSDQPPCAPVTARMGAGVPLRFTISCAPWKKCLQAARRVNGGTRRAPGRGPHTRECWWYHCHWLTLISTVFIIYVPSTLEFLILVFLTVHCLTDKLFLKEFIICTASCMQINQPTIKVKEQSTKSYSRRSQPTATSWGGRRLSLVTEEPGTLLSPCVYPRSLHQSTHAQAATRGSVACVPKAQWDTGMFCERCKIFKVVIQPSVQIHNPGVL